VTDDRDTLTDEDVITVPGSQSTGPVAQDTDGDDQTDTDSSDSGSDTDSNDSGSDADLDDPS
jgi:hypothetical protein